MNYFQVSWKLRQLTSFKDRYIEYLHALDKEQSARAAQSRQELNALAIDVDKIMLDVGAGVLMAAPPPMYGGRYREIHVATELFNPYAQKVLGITPSIIVNQLDQAIGEHQRIARRAFLNLFNPLWWLKEILSFIVSLPFYLLGISGFDQQRIEQSTAAKVLKLIMAVLVLIATITTILVNFNILGWKFPWLG